MSTAGERWDVEVWHDTTMWNEGFEQAREPYAIVNVSTDLDAVSVAAWVDTTFALSTLPWADMDKAFTAKVTRILHQHPGVHAATSVADAQQFISARVAEWRGL